MNHLKAHSDAEYSSMDRDVGGGQLLKRFRLICRFSHMSDDIMKEIDLLQHEHNRTGFFSKKSWLKFLELFQLVANTRKQSNVLFMDPHQKSASKKLAGVDPINDSLFEFKVSIIRGILGSLKREIEVLQSGPMTLDTAEYIAEIEHTAGYFSRLLANPYGNIDWKTLRAFMDNAEERIQDAKQTGAMFNAKIDSIIRETETQSTSEPTTDEMREMKREYAWGNLLHSQDATNHQYISNHELERIKTNLHPDFSYDAVTNTIITTVKHAHKEAPGMEALDLNNPETRKAMAKVLKQQGSIATPLSIEVRDDLHKIYGTRAANGELMYNTLAETFSGDATWQPIDLVVGGFEEFQILTNERNAPNSPWYTLRVVARRYGSNKQEILTVMCKPEEVRAGAQGRFAIKTRLPATPGEKEPKYTTTIEFLDVSRIRNMRKPRGASSENNTQKSFWDKTKESVKNTWNNWFSKKAA